MSTVRPGGVAIGSGLLLGLATALLALATAGAGAAVLAGVLVTGVSYLAAVFAGRAARLPRDTTIRPRAGDPADALVRRTEHSAAAAVTLLDSIGGGPLGDQLEPVRRDVASAVAYARDLATRYAAVREPLAALDPAVPAEHAAAERLSAAGRGLLDQLTAHAVRLECTVADLGELASLDLAARDPLTTDGGERLRGLCDGLAQAARLGSGGTGGTGGTAAEASVDSGAPPGTMKEPLNERTG